MKTTVLTIVMTLISLTLYGQNFTYFNEVKSIPELTTIVPKGQTRIYYTGGNGVFYIDDKVGFMKEMASDFFHVFKNIRNSDVDKFSQISINVYFSGKLKTDYVKLSFKKEYKSFVLQNEKQFYKYAKSLDMIKHKHLFYYKEGFVGGTLSFPVKTFFKYRYEIGK